MGISEMFMLLMFIGVVGVIYYSIVLSRKEEKENPSVRKAILLMVFMALNYMGAFVTTIIFLIKSDYLYAVVTVAVCYSAYKYANIRGHGKATWESE